MGLRVDVKTKDNEWSRNITFQLGAGGIYKLLRKRGATFFM